MRKDFLSTLFLINEGANFKFSIIEKNSSKLIFIYSNVEWLVPVTIIFKFNSLFYMTFLIEMFGVDGISKIKNNNFLTYIYIYYMYFFNIKFFFSFSAYYSQKISSISSFFQNAQWPEREISEMNGTFFFNKLDNRKLLLDYSFVGHPLLKIYPTIGFIEIIYSFINSWISVFFLQYSNGISNDVYFDL